MRNRFYASFRIAANAKRTPQLTRKVKNCNAPQNKINSAINWQKSYRLEWYLIIWHYLNLYVYCISFLAKHLLLWKLTGAKSNFESMCLQERNLFSIEKRPRGRMFLYNRKSSGEKVLYGGSFTLWHRHSSPSSSDHKAIDKCIHIKYMCLNQWTMVCTVPVIYKRRCVRSTHARDTLNKFVGRQA